MKEIKEHKDIKPASWTCLYCGEKTPSDWTEHPKVTCDHCGKVHAVTGRHITGAPIVHMIAGQS